MAEIEESAQTITQQAAPDANIIFGASIDEKLENKIKIIVIATGFTSLTKPAVQQKSFIPKLNTNSSPVNPPFQKDNPPKSVSQQDIEQLLGNQNLPEGLDITDQYDIPTFLRKKN